MSLSLTHQNLGPGTPILSYGSKLLNWFLLKEKKTNLNKLLLSRLYLLRCRSLDKDGGGSETLLPTVSQGSGIFSVLSRMVKSDPDDGWSPSRPYPLLFRSESWTSQGPFLPEMTRTNPLPTIKVVCKGRRRCCFGFNSGVGHYSLEGLFPVFRIKNYPIVLKHFRRYFVSVRECSLRRARLRRVVWRV